MLNTQAPARAPRRVARPQRDYLITVDEQLQAAMKALHQRYLVDGKLGAFRKAVRAIIQDRVRLMEKPYEIVVRDHSSPVTSHKDEITLGVYVNGVLDQGLRFGKLKPDGTIYGTPANDA